MLVNVSGHHKMMQRVEEDKLQQWWCASIPEREGAKRVSQGVGWQWERPEQRRSMTLFNIYNGRGTDRPGNTLAQCTIGRYRGP